MISDRIPTRCRAPILLGASIVCAGALLSGCMSSPTYGTGKTANAQLLEDVTGILSIGPKDTPEIAYTPRAELVKPASLEVLPEPQQDVASADNPAWPESPEQRRARIRAEATANQNNPFYRPKVAAAAPVGDTRNLYSSTGGLPETFDDPDKSMNSPAASLHQTQRIELQRRIRENNQGSATSRKYLSEPPLDYRQPAETAAAGELGTPEWKKELEGKRARGEKKTWRDFIPGF